MTNLLKWCRVYKILLWFQAFSIILGFVCMIAAMLTILTMNKFWLTTLIVVYAAELGVCFLTKVVRKIIKNKFIEEVDANCTKKSVPEKLVKVDALVEADECFKYILHFSEKPSVETQNFIDVLRRYMQKALGLIVYVCYANDYCK